MTLSRLLTTLSLLITLLFTLSPRTLHAAAGDLDTLDIALSNNLVSTIALQPDGKILIGGTFTSVAGVTRNRIARINPDGTLDAGFNPNANGNVASIMVQTDGKIILGGFFTTLQPDGSPAAVTRRSIARLNADGSLDAGFDPNADLEVLSIVEQADGKILIAGRFTTLQPNGAAAASSRSRVARLNADGSLDTSMVPVVSGGTAVQSLAIQSDGKILIVGTFTSVAGTSRSNIARLNADGTLDTVFSPNANDVIRCIALQADGKILVGGDFSSVGGNIRRYIARLNTDGKADAGFSPTVNARVNSMALQADGRILVAGSFTSLQPGGASSSLVRNRIARLESDGTLDMGFDPNANSIVQCVALQPDGRILLGGYFSALKPNGNSTATTRIGLARLLNDPATQALTAPAGNQVSWTLGGSFPQFRRVSFQLSTDEETTWTSLGEGSRVGVHNTWRMTGLSLPTGGKIRAFGVTSDGGGSAGGLIQSVADFSASTPLPVINVFTGAGTTTSNERLDDRGRVLLGSPPQTFTIRNTGSATLTNLSATLSGADPGDFILGSFGTTTLPPGGTTSFTVTISPSVVGSRQAVVSLASNDPSVTPFRINLGNLLPEIVVRGSGLNIPDGSTTPGSDNHTDFGMIPVSGNGSTLTRAYTIYNAGPGDLALGSVAIGGENAADFTVTHQPAAVVGTLRSTEFYITFDPSAVGLRRATVSFATNDADETAYNFNIQGTGYISSNADLSSLTTTPGTLTPSFSTATTSYAVNLPFGDTRYEIRPKKAEMNASISYRVNGGPLTEMTNDRETYIPLVVGANAIEVLVTAQDGTTVKTYAISVGRGAAQPGDLDPLNPVVYGSGVRAIALQTDGKMLLGGGISYAEGVFGGELVRLNTDGSLDTAFDPQVSGTVNRIAVQTDGKILICGEFSYVQPNGAEYPIDRKNIARLNADGSVDTGFDPKANRQIISMALQADGKILLGGEFTTLQPPGEAAPIPRNRLARLNPDGTLDTGFDPAPNNHVYSLAIQADGRILAGGSFTSFQPNGAASPTNRRYLARLNADGSLDSGYNPGVSNSVYCLTLQNDGKVLAGGAFLGLGDTGHAYIGRLRPDGTVDTTFNTTTNGGVSCITLQADGKILIGGGFTMIYPTSTYPLTQIARHGLARMNPDGTLDSGFNPNPDSSVSSIVLQTDGQMLLGGPFGSFSPNGATIFTDRNLFARIINEPSFQSLTVTGNNRVEWLRGGSSPEVEQVTFESSTDNGASYSPLARGIRINGGWAADNLSIPAGIIRARGRAEGSLIETVTAFGIPSAPEINITGNGGTISSGSTAATPANHTDFENVLLYGIGAGLTRTFTIANTGTTNLTLGTVTVSGANAAEFTVSRQPVYPVLPGRTTTFTITFAPGEEGLRSAMVSLDNNDTDESHYSFAIQGTGFISSNADLLYLSPIGGTMTPEFSPDITNYFVNLPHGDGSINFMAYRAEENADVSIRLNGGEYIITNPTNHDPDVSLQVGMNMVEIRVTAQNGTTKIYSITVIRAPMGPGDLLPMAAGNAVGGVAAFAIQPDGKTVMAGNVGIDFGGVSRGYIARTTADGTLDTGFDPRPDNIVRSVIVQTDGKLVICGDFSTFQPYGAISPIARKSIARLNADGSLDNTIDPNPNGPVHSMAIQADGKILLAGGFTTLRPTGSASPIPRNHLARLNVDGTLDTTFDPNADSDVFGIAVQEDGRILLGGMFTTLQPNGAAASIARQYIARVNEDGTLDSAFDPNANYHVQSLVLQADGKILVGGSFSALQPNGAATPTKRNRIARLHSDGTLDTGFAPDANGSVYSISLQADGGILLGGEFTMFQPNGAETGTVRNYSALLDPDGTLDPIFDPHTDANVYAVAIQSEGQVLLGGNFTSLSPNGTTTSVRRPAFARIFNSPATQVMSLPDASHVNWTRGGSSPEVSQVTFELSTDGGVSYALLGSGTRMGNTSNWQLGDLDLPTGGLLRARGRTTGGYSNGSSGLVESVISFGTASTPHAVWRQSSFGSPANNGNGADNADPDHDGLANLIEYAFGLDPNSPDAHQLPQPLLVGGNLTATFTPPAGADGVTYGAQWSENLTDWHPATDMNTTPQRTFTVPMADRKKLYMRLTLTAQ